MEIETPVLLAYAIEDSTDIFRISGGGVEHPKPPLSVRHWFPGRILWNSEVTYSVAVWSTQPLTEIRINEFPSCAECQSKDESPTFHLPSDSS